jgi:hypothetical protein
MQLLQNKIVGAPVAVQRRSRVQSARQTHVRVQAAAATEVKLNTTKSDEVSNPAAAKRNCVLACPVKHCKHVCLLSLNNCRS